MRMPRLTLAFALLTLSGFAMLSYSRPAFAAAPVDPKTITEIDAGLGPCTADFTITDEANKPIYAASIRVHIAYGFLNAHKLDLEAGANADGKARFIGLPDRSRQGLFFSASEGDREGSAFDDPSKTCKTQFTIVLRKKPQS
jgi:hypothetical protein